jgi:hypothetical protein
VPSEAAERDLLFYFNGNLGGTEQFQNYSFGIRQQLRALYGHLAPRATAYAEEVAPDLPYKNRVIITDVKTSRYSQMLSRSVFCGVMPGWGWSGRFEDAVLHGCIPVILQDEIDAPFDTVLDWRTYALRVPRAQMHTMLERLLAIPERQRLRMQAILDRVWPRFTYAGVVEAEHQRASAEGRKPGPGIKLGRHARGDAVATLLTELKARLHQRRLRKHAEDGTAGLSFPSVAANGMTAGGCEVSKSGVDVSPKLSDGIMATLNTSVMRTDFHGRTVNGWVI